MRKRSRDENAAMWANMNRPAGIKSKSTLQNEFLVTMNKTAPRRVKFTSRRSEVKNYDGKRIPVLYRNMQSIKTPMSALESVLSRADEDVISNINSVVVVPRVKDDPVVAMINIDLGKIILYEQPYFTKEEYEDVIIHELEHMWFRNKSKSNPKAIEKYSKEVDSLPPITDYLRAYWNEVVDLKTALKKKEFNEEDKKQVEKYLERQEGIYHDEFHSETGEIVQSKDLHNNARTVIVNEDVIEQAIALYKGLHK